MILYRVFILLVMCSINFFRIVFSAPQREEINDLENSTNNNITVSNKPATLTHLVTVVTKTESKPEVIAVPSVTRRLCNIIAAPFLNFVAVPKVKSVLRNIGTCIVNGAMEIVTYYFPAPLIPLIASAAGMVIPFEPVVMLREKMPVTSYRRAFRTALNSFLGTFDRYRLEDEDDDPYMTRRFNRRFMNDNLGKSKE